jgi:predicted phosphodiesterase
LAIERLARPRETNDAGRSAVARAVLAEQVDALVHLGDVVGRASDWGRFDQDYPPDVLANQVLHVCRGNHDRGGLWFGSAKTFECRFPLAVGRQQTVTHGCVRLFLLDSNRDVMTQDQWRRQQHEYIAALQATEADERVVHVIVACHHPPFTNARWHLPSRSVEDAFAPAFLGCRKARLFLSGHVHGYERFRFREKDFVVSGGGGGARFGHRHGDRCRLEAVVDLPDPHPFHYGVVEATNDSFSCTIKAADANGGRARVLDQF